MKRLLVILGSVAALTTLAVSAPSFCWKVTNGVFLSQVNLGHCGFSGPDTEAVSPILTHDKGKDDDDGADDKDKDTDEKKGKDEGTGWDRLWDTSTLG